MKRIKESYLLFLIVLSLFSLSIYSTYALFTDSRQVMDYQVNIAESDFSLDKGIQYKRVDVYAEEAKNIKININNNSGGSRNYQLWYQMISPSVKPDGLTIKYKDTDAVQANIANLDKATVNISLINNTDSVISLYIGINTDKAYTKDELVTMGRYDITDTYSDNYLASYIDNLYETNAKATVVNNGTTYEYSDSVSLINDGFGNGNIRYFGASPSNYILFNNELWRIIGVFDISKEGNGLAERRVRIVRNSGVGLFSFDNKSVNVNGTGEFGTSNYADSRLEALLNPGHEDGKELALSSSYYNYKPPGSLYWNRQSGQCYKTEIDIRKADDNVVSCDFTNIGLLKKAREMIDKAYYKIGILSDMKLSAKDVYQMENADLYNQWEGMVSLISLSDYVYATNFNQCKSLLTDYSDESCIGSNWLGNLIGARYGKHEDKIDETIYSLATLTMDSVESETVAAIDYGGSVKAVPAYTSFYVYPVVTLAKDVILTGGKGSISEPYTISLLKV